MTKLTETEIQQAQLGWRHYHMLSSLGFFLQIEGFEKRFPFFNELRNHNVIEIGPGKNPVNSHFQCGSYCAADGEYPNDGLSFLRRKKSESAVVVSFGVIDDVILMLDHKDETIGLRYVNDLITEIKRVSKPFSLIAGADVQKYMGMPDVPILDNCTEYGGIYYPKKPEFVSRRMH